ncbi:MAG: hypothetical protein E7384_05150 [Ruminococcaceae bacterium]|nr:hypothetical protein [Oscillospiraceae bacterium]
MIDFEKRDFYMRWLYRIAYKFYMMDPWKDRNYFDFSALQYAHNGAKVRYVVNFENYNTVTQKNDSQNTRTIWLHVPPDDDTRLCRMRAYCCIFTAFKDIPEKYLQEVEKWKKQPFSDEYTPFFVDFAEKTPKPLDFDNAKQMYYLMNNSYNLMISGKEKAAHTYM